MAVIGSDRLVDIDRLNGYLVALGYDGLLEIRHRDVSVVYTQDMKDP